MFDPPLTARRLLAGPRPTSRSWYEFRAASGDEEVDELFVYDVVAWWAVDAKAFVAELAKLTAPTLRVRINSPGGSVFDGLAIYNSLRRHPARVEVRVEGVAASIASVIALAGDHVAIEPSAFFMIHDPWSAAIGNSTELRELADVLDKIGEKLVGIYARKSGAAETAIAELMAAETWLNAEEAHELGLVDEVLADDADATARSRHDLSGFANPPKALVEEPAGESVAAALAETPLEGAEAAGAQVETRLRRLRLAELD